MIFSSWAEKGRDMQLGDEGGPSVAVQPGMGRGQEKGSRR